MGRPADPRPGVPGAGRRRYSGVPPGQVFPEARGKDQPVTTGQRSTVTGTGHHPFPGPGGDRILIRKVGRIIEAGQPQPQRLDTQHPADAHLGVPLLQRHLQPGRHIGPESAIAQHAQHRRAAVVMQPPAPAAVAEAPGVP